MIGGTAFLPTAMSLIYISSGQQDLTENLYEHIVESVRCTRLVCCLDNLVGAVPPWKEDNSKFSEMTAIFDG